MAIGRDGSTAPPLAADPPDRGSFYGWKLAGLLWLGMAISTALPLYGLSILNVHMADDLHFNQAALGSTYAAYMLMTGLPGPIVARLIDRKGIRATLVFGNLLQLAGTVAMATVVKSPLMLLAVGGLVIGASNAFAGPIAIQASVARWFTRRRALAMGLVMTGGSLIGVAFPPLLEWIVSTTGSWRYAWWVVAALTAVLVVGDLLFVREHPADLGQHPDGTGPALEPALEAVMAPGVVRVRRRLLQVHRTEQEWRPADVLRAKAFWLLLLCSAGVMAVYTIFLAQGVPQMRHLGYSTGTASWMLSLSVGVGFVAHMAISLLGDRVDPRAMWAAGLVCQGLGIALLAQAGQMWMLYAAVIALGIGGAASILCVVMVFSNWFGAAASPFVFGFGSAVAAAFGAIAPIASGYCFDWTGSFAPVFHAVAAICMLEAALLMMIAPPVRRV